MSFEHKMSALSLDDTNSAGSEVATDSLSPTKVIDQLTVTNPVDGSATKWNTSAVSTMDPSKFILFVSPKASESGKWQTYTHKLHRQIQFHYPTRAGYDACATNQPGRWIDNGEAVEKADRSRSDTIDSFDRVENLYHAKRLDDCHEDCRPTHDCTCPGCQDTKSGLSDILSPSIADPQQPLPAMFPPKTDDKTLTVVHRNGLKYNVPR